MNVQLLLTVTPLEIIRALEGSELDQESVSFCHTCTFVTDPVVPAPQHETQKASSTGRDDYRPSWVSTREKATTKGCR